MDRQETFITFLCLCNWPSQTRFWWKERAYERKSESEA